MSIFSKLSLVAIAAGVALSGMASSASAGGFLADTFIKPFNPGLAKKADEVHKQLGNPIEHGAAAAMDYYYPGSGRIYIQNAPGVRR